MKPAASWLDWVALTITWGLIIGGVLWCSHEDVLKPLRLNDYKMMSVHGLMTPDDYQGAIQLATQEKEYKLALLFADALPQGHKHFTWAQEQKIKIKKFLNNKFGQARYEIRQSQTNDD